MVLHDLTHLERQKAVVTRSFLSASAPLRLSKLPFLEVKP